MADTSTQQTIVVGVDGSEASKSALTWAIEEARLRGATVLAVNAWQFPLVAFGDYGGTGVPMLTSVDLEKLAESTVRDAVADVVGDDVSVPVTTSVRNGHPARELVDASTGADLLVVGSIGHGGFAGMLLGSVSAHVVHHATCPVAIVRPGWKPPTR
jgi:nucleotide-binding universal stress UspA family protein